MPLLTDEDVGLGQSTLSDADVGLTPKEFSDADVGLSGPYGRPDTTKNRLLDAGARGVNALADVLTHVTPASAVMESVNEINKRASKLLHPENTPPNLNAPALSPEQVGDIGQAVWNNTFGTPGGVPSPPEAQSPVERGIKRFGKEAVSGMTTPENALAVGAPAVAGPEAGQAVARMFQTQMAADAPKAAADTLDAIKRGDTEQAVKSGLDTLMTVATPAMIERELRARSAPTLSDAEVGLAPKTPVNPPEQEAPIQVTPDVAKDLIEQLTKGQIRPGEEARPGQVSAPAEPLEPTQQVSPAGQLPEASLPEGASLEDPDAFRRETEEAIKQDIQGEVDKIDVQDMRGNEQGVAQQLTALMERAGNWQHLRPALPEAFKKVGDAAREQGADLDAIKRGILGELRGIYGADAPEMVEYYFGKAPESVKEIEQNHEQVKPAPLNQNVETSENLNRPELPPPAEPTAPEQPTVAPEPAGESPEELQRQLAAELGQEGEATPVESKQQQELPGETDPVTQALEKATEALQAAKEQHQKANGIETDPARVQEIRNSIAEGQLTLRTGTFHGRKLSPEELLAVRRSVESAQAKIGESRLAGKTVGAKITDVTPEGYGPSIGGGIKAALEKNKGGEAGFVRIPSREELMDRMSEIPGFGDAWKATMRVKRKVIDYIQRSPERDKISALKDAAKNMAVNMGENTGNHILHELNRALGVKDVQERNQLREHALTFAIEAGGDRGQLHIWRDMLARSEVAPSTWKRRAIQALRFADQNWDKLQPVVDRYSEITDAENQYENANGVPTLYRKGGYVFHAQDLESTYNTGENVVGGGGKGASTPFRKARDYPTYAEAIANGVHPKNLSAVDLMKERIKLGQHAVNMLDWMEALQHMTDKPSKLPVVVRPEWTERTGHLGPETEEGFPASEDTQGTWTVPPQYSVQDFGGRKIGLHKGYTGLFNQLTDASWFQRSAGTIAVQKVWQASKHTALLFDTYHLGRLAFWNSLSRGSLPKLPTYSRGLTILENTLPEIQHMISRGEIPEEWGKNLVADKQRLNTVLKNGGNLAGIGDNLHTEFLRQIPGLGTFNKWLFDKYQRGAMAEVSLMNFDRLEQQHPDWTQDQIGRQVAKDVNTRFGNLQSQAWLKSKTGQDLARLVFLAPQWNESLIRSELGAMKQFGQAGANIARGRAPALGMLARGIGTAMLGTFIANQIINMYTRGHPTWDNPEEEAGAKISAWIPDKVGGGPGMFLNPMSLPAEMSNLLYRGMDRHLGEGKRFDEALALSMLDMAKSRFSSPARGLYTMITGQTTMGVPVKNRVTGALQEAIPTPLSAGSIYRAGKQVLTGEHSEKFPGEFEKQGLQSFGLKTEQAPDSSQRIYNLAERFKTGQTDQKGTEQNAKGRDLPVYQELTKAVKLGNMTDANAAIDKLLTTAKNGAGDPYTLVDIAKHFQSWPRRPFTNNSKLEPAFYQSLTPAQQQVYKDALQDRARIAQAIGELLAKRSKG